MVVVGVFCFEISDKTFKVVASLYILILEFNMHVGHIASRVGQ